MASSAQIVVFDLDHTLVHCDSFARFNRMLLLRDWWRVGLTVVAAPVIGLLFFPSRSRIYSLSALVWIGTVGIGNSELERLMDRHVARHYLHPSRMLCAAALAAFHSHVTAGNRLLIATGAVSALAQRVCVALGLHGVEVVGSTLRPWLGGWVAEKHCFGEAKVAMLTASGAGECWDCAYTDSASDIPLLSRAKKRVLVNPKPAHLRRVVAALGQDVEVMDSRRPHQHLTPKGPVALG